MIMPFKINTVFCLLIYAAASVMAVCSLAVYAHAKVWYSSVFLLEMGSLMPIFHVSLLHPSPEKTTTDYRQTIFLTVSHVACKKSRL
jgi:hypothetical protein